MNHPAGPAFDPARWRKSSYSGSDGGCVEINSSTPGWVGLRHSKHGDASPVARFTSAQWRTFQTEVRTRLTGANGIVEVDEHTGGWDVRVLPTGAVLQFSAFEIECFRKAVTAREFD
uniref:DUF397 domain-containing protein n=1 Tax=Amycolatopsis sp. CA-096443 TaxID=3239919 RepID=UPI003F499F10